MEEEKIQKQRQIIVDIYIFAMRVRKYIKILTFKLEDAF